MKVCNYKKGFTLAEVLITLGVIGVVAAMTLPTLIQHHKEKVATTKLKKAYSTLSNAYILARNENQDISSWFETENSSEWTTKVFENLKPYLNISKVCGFEKGCLTNGPVKTLHRTNYVNYDEATTEYRFVLSDGTQVMLYISNPNCNELAPYCGNIKVDIDGYRGPYVLGKDFFIFNIFYNRILPAGIPEDTRTVSFEDGCNVSKTTHANGLSCAAWVIYNENMDYLHCDDLSWNGKHKCK